MKRDYLTKKDYKAPKCHPRRRRKNKTLPDQAMPMSMIMDKFTRNVPVNVIRHESVYMDENDEFDFEKISRMDFGEKAALAAEMKERAARIKQELTDVAEAERKAQEDAKKISDALQAPEKPGSAEPKPKA